MSRARCRSSLKFDLIRAGASNFSNSYTSLRSPAHVSLAVPNNYHSSRKSSLSETTCESEAPSIIKSHDNANVGNLVNQVRNKAKFYRKVPESFRLHQITPIQQKDEVAFPKKSPKSPS